MLEAWRLQVVAGAGDVRMVPLQVVVVLDQVFRGIVGVAMGYNQGWSGVGDGEWWGWVVGELRVTMITKFTHTQKNEVTWSPRRLNKIQELDDQQGLAIMYSILCFWLISMY